MRRNVLGPLLGLLTSLGTLGCGHRWGPRAQTSPAGSVYAQMLSTEGGFELKHDGSLGVGRGVILSELLTSYMSHQGPLTALEGTRLTVDFTRRPLSPLISTVEASLRLKDAERVHLVSLKVSLIGQTATAEGALASPSGGLERALARRLGAQLASVMLERD